MAKRALLRETMKEYTALMGCCSGTVCRWGENHVESHKAAVTDNNKISLVSLGSSAGLFPIHFP